MTRYTVTFEKPHALTDGEETTLLVGGYEDVGSMYILELIDGATQSVGKQLVADITQAEE